MTSMRCLLVSAAASALCAGMLSAPATAADLPARAVPYVKAPVMTPAHDWAGFYIGANYSLVGQHSRASSSLTPGIVDLNSRGFAGGLQLGYNALLSPSLLAGIEGDFGYLGADRALANWNTPALGAGVDTSWYGTVRARLGLVMGPTLIYGTGGAAFLRLKDTFGTAAAPSYSHTATGWALGGGIETKLSRRWSVTTEYLYIDGGRSSFATVTPAGAETAQIAHRFHVLRTGINYQLHGPDEPLPFFRFGASASGARWSGLYAGMNGGAGLSMTTASGGPLTTGAADLNGVGASFGGHIGYNFALPFTFIGHFIGGVEADIAWLDLNRRNTDWSDAVTFSQRANWYGTARGRVGYANGPGFVYLTGGAAWVGIENGLESAGLSSVARRTASGWTVGSGTEIALSSNLSGRFEYLYIDAGKNQSAVGVQDATFHTRFQVVRAGLTYHFGGPVVARY